MESLYGKSTVALPPLIEGNTMPDDKPEIPTADITQHFAHLSPVRDKIPPPDPDAQILLLLGRDVLSVHKVREQYNGPHNTPYAQRLDLGWVIVGEICLDRVQQPAEVNVNKTNILSNGGTSFFTPCSKSIQVREQIGPRSLLCLPDSTHDAHHSCTPFIDQSATETTFFVRNADDEKLALSIEYNIFLEVMDKSVYLDEHNQWVAPLPFRSPRTQLPNNKMAHAAW